MNVGKKELQSTSNSQVHVLIALIAYSMRDEASPVPPE
jgi:hypothetical protein